MLGDLRDYWSVALPELYGVEAVSPSAFIEYRTEEDAPVCGGEKVPTGNAKQTYLRAILLIADHTAYHVGQLVALRRAMGLW